MVLMSTFDSPDKAGDSSLTASLWSWGAKAAAAATDVVAKVDTGKLSTGVNNFSSYLDSVFPDPYVLVIFPMRTLLQLTQPAAITACLLATTFVVEM